MSTLLLLLLLLLTVLLSSTTESMVVASRGALGDTSSFSFVQITDIHIGDSNSTLRLQNAVKEINRMVQTKQRDIRFVFATGDLTASAVHRQFEICKSVLDQLVIPWIPMIGNHDIWTYNSTYEEPVPTADLFFGKLFAEQFSKIQKQFGGDIFEYTQDTVINQEHANITSWFHNFILRVNDKLTILAVDWNSRQHAAKQLGYKGSWPGAELHNFAGGTFQWLEKQLQHIKTTGVPSDFKIMFLQHHPFRTPTFVPEMIYSFSGSKKKEIRNLLAKYLPIEKYWGHFAGHFHRWYSGQAFDEKEWRSFLQWESCACKVDGSFAVINIENYNQVQSIEKVIAGPQ